MRDTKSNNALVQLLEPTNLVHTNTTSDILDTANFNGAIVAVNVAALTGVDGSNYITLTLEESNTVVGTDFTTVAAGDLVGAFTVINSTAKDSVVQYVGYTGIKRYIRAKITYTGTGISAGVVGVTGILNEGKFEPVTAPAAISAT